MSQEEQKPRRRAYRSLRHPEAAAMVDEWEEVSILTPAELRRYTGCR
jgi:hypothetical protein